MVKERVRNPKKEARKVGKSPLPEEERMSKEWGVQSLDTVL